MVINVLWYITISVVSRATISLLNESQKLQRLIESDYKVVKHFLDELEHCGYQDA